MTRAYGRQVTYQTSCDLNRPAGCFAWPRSLRILAAPESEVAILVFLALRGVETIYMKSFPDLAKQNFAIDTHQIQQYAVPVADTFRFQIATAPD